MITPPRDPQRGEDVLPWAQQVAKLLRALRPQAGPDIAPRIQSGGTVYELVRRRQVGSGGGTATHPFQVTAAAPDPEGGEGAPARLQVELDSWLMAGPEADDKVTITGLGSPFEITPVDGRAKIFLEAAIAGGAVTACAVKHGDEWDDDFPKPVGWDPSESDPERTQEKAFILLAYLEAQSAGNAAYTNRATIKLGATTYQIVQCVRDHLLLCRTCYSVTGDNVRLFVPWFAPYVEL